MSDHDSSVGANSAHGRPFYVETSFGLASKRIGVWRVSDLSGLPGNNEPAARRDWILSAMHGIKEMNRPGNRGGWLV